MKSIVIVAAKRTPMGSFGGSFSSIPAPKLNNPTELFVTPGLLSGNDIVNKYKNQTGENLAEGLDLICNKNFIANEIVKKIYYQEEIDNVNYYSHGSISIDLDNFFLLFK